MASKSDDALIVSADEIPSKGLTRQFTATDAVRDSLSRRFGYREISAFHAAFDLKPLAGGPMIRVSGTISAAIEQTCVVTGEPVQEQVNAGFDIDFAPPGMIDENLELTLSDADPPEPLESEGIDLFELAAQQLVLSASEYPRVEGVDLPTVLKTLPAHRKKALAGPEKDNPFAKLAGLKNRRNSD